MASLPSLSACSPEPEYADVVCAG